MAKHRAVSHQSLRTRTVIGGVLAAGAVMVAAPAGIALADNGGLTGGGGTSFTSPATRQATLVAKREPSLRDLVRRWIAHERNEHNPMAKAPQAQAAR
jgi:hypothetical protein